MIKKFKNIDSIFKSSYDGFEEEPSAGLWSKINEGLDKQDVVRFKRRFIAWKRNTLLLILLMTIYVLYDSLVRNQEINRAVSVKQHSAKTAVSPAFPSQARTLALRVKSFPDYIASRKTMEFGDMIRSRPTQAIQFSPIAPLVTNPDFLVQVSYSLASNADKHAFKNEAEGKNNLIKPNLFRPYWSLSAVASYDQVMYRLDDDLPGDSKKILKAGKIISLRSPWRFQQLGILRGAGLCKRVWFIRGFQSA